MAISRDKNEKSDQKKAAESWQMKKKKSICPDCKLSFRIEDLVEKKNNEIQNGKKLSKRVDQVSFALCLITFLLFNLLFWKFYL